MPGANSKVRVASTGGKAERTDRVPIRQHHNDHPVVALALGPDDGKPPLAELRARDQILVSAELELTTDCEQRQSDCVAEPYDIEPEIQSQLLLARSPSITAPSRGEAVALTQPRQEKLSHARHHTVLVYDNERHRMAADDISWAGPSYVNLVVSARHDQPGEHHIVLIGQNDEGGTIGGDMAGLCVVRIRPPADALATTLGDNKRLAEEIPVIKGERRVVYSRQLDDLRKGDQLAIRAKVGTSTAHLSYTARTTVRVFLADRPDQDSPGDHAKEITVSNGEISRLNGTNRLPSERGGATNTKVGVLRVSKDAERALFVNVIVVTGDPLQKAKAGDSMRILNQGGIEIERYPAELDG